MAAHPGEAAWRVGIAELEGWPGSPGETEAAGVDWALWVSSSMEHEAVARAQRARSASEGTRRVTRGPFLLGDASNLSARAALQGTYSVANSDVSDEEVEVSGEECVRTTA